MCARVSAGEGVDQWGVSCIRDALTFHVIVRTHFSLDINCVSSPRALQRNLHVRSNSCSCFYFLMAFFPFFYIYFCLFHISVLIFILHVAASIKENDFVA